MSFLKKNCCDGIYESSIDIRFTKLCDNRCDFCIEDNHGCGSFGRTNVERMVHSVRNGVLYEGKDTVLILGGEPFLFVDQLCDFVHAIRDDVKKIYITTSVPKELDIYNPKIHHIMENIDGLNISLHHWDSDRNNEILKATRKIDRIDLIEDLAFWFGGKIRLQCNLVKGGIETAEDVHKLINLANKLDVAEVKLNELQDVGEDLYVSFDKLFPNIKLGNPYSKGCVSNVGEYFHKAYFELTVKRACFMVQEHSPHGASLLDLIKVVLKKFKRRKWSGANVIYENGLRASGWLTKETLIHKEKA